MTHTDNVLETPWGELRLHRWPASDTCGLQAWDGADRLALQWLQEAGGQQATWVVNETWGCLSVAALRAGQRCHALVDSFCGLNALLANAAGNALDAPEHGLLFERPAFLPDRVIVRVPKSLDLLAWQLAWLNSVCAPETEVWLIGMDKHLPATLRPQLEQSLAMVSTERGRYKAHLFRGRTQPGPPPACPWVGTELPEVERTLDSLPGVFAASRIDPGGRYLLAHLPPTRPGQTVVDLGCGSGMLGLSMALREPALQLVMIDDSALALKAARRNAACWGIEPERIHFRHGDGLAGWDGRADLIVLNPPFHEGHGVTTETARRLVAQAGQCLATDGELRMVVNRHLDYRDTLKRHFRHWEQVAQNGKFRLLSARQATPSRALP